jgi:hypothetical protein
MNGQDLATADITDQIPEIDIGTAEGWRLCTGRSAIVLAVSHVFPVEGPKAFVVVTKLGGLAAAIDLPKAKPALRQCREQHRTEPGGG